ncbi:HicB family protein [Candidatus Woesearchaeota archaeon CG10_big_fil_rev_8_21_14_0_10_30_7]|nr:MAG: HicB family protein [Candidatus Woesearchaeota archaeon CG10_big_fil_rev_8_21_14_0_10_30_7]
MKITVILEPAEEGGFIAYIPSLPGCISEGDTREEALKNIKEALELYIEPDTNELIEFTGEKVALTV